MCVAQEFIAEGGMDAAKDLLISAFGDEKAGAIVGRVLQAMQVMPFDFLKKADATQIITFIQNEHPQTIALILAYLQPAQAAAIMSGLPQDLRADVARRIATLDKTPPEVIREVEHILQRKLSSVVSTDFTHAGGVKSLVEVLNWVDRSTEKTILESLSENNPEIAEEVKKLMFVFEDIVLLDDRAIQQVLKEVDTKELSLALRGVGETRPGAHLQEHVRAGRFDDEGRDGVHGAGAPARGGGGPAAGRQHHPQAGRGRRDHRRARRRRGDDRLTWQ